MSTRCCYHSLIETYLKREKRKIEKSIRTTECSMKRGNRSKHKSKFMRKGCECRIIFNFFSFLIYVLVCFNIQEKTYAFQGFRKYIHQK